jgi:DNA invertase Pin-like site-specific DNA recombinase
MSKGAFADADVREIRRRYECGERLCKLADDYCVSRTTISAAVSGRRYRHVPGSVRVRRFRPVGSVHGQSKLKETDIPSIRELRANYVELKEIADRFGVSITAISLILAGKTWKHVEPVTVHRFRWVGSGHKRSKLKEADIRSIRELRAKGTTLREIADRFGVSFSTIFQILSGTTWRHVV